MDIVYPDKYYDKIKEKFPELSDAQIEKIVLYGIRSIFIMSHYNVDIKAQQGKFFMYFGHIFTNSKMYHKYRRIKLSARYRVLSMREKKPYNGKCYFLLTDDQYKKATKKSLALDYVIIYKLQKEAELQDGSYLYEVDWPNRAPFRKIVPTAGLKYRLIAKRNLKDPWGDFIPIGTETIKEKTVKRPKNKKEKK